MIIEAITGLFWVWSEICFIAIGIIIRVVVFDGTCIGINKDLYCAILKRINVHFPDEYFLVLGFLFNFSSLVQCVKHKACISYELRYISKPGWYLDYRKKRINKNESTAILIVLNPRVYKHSIYFESKIS